MEDVPDDGIAFGVDVLDDAEDAGFDVGGAELPVDDAEVGEVVADNVLAGDHGGGGFAAGGRIGAAEVGLASVGAVGTHDEHVLGEPAFGVGSADGQSQGELLESDGVAGVLGVDGVDGVSRVIHVDAVQFVVLAGHAFVDFAGAMTIPEELEIRVVALSFEFLVTGTIEHVLAVDDVGRVGDLETGDREYGVDRTQAEEAHQHGPALIGAALEVFEFCEPFVASDLLELRIEILVVRHEILGHVFAAGLVVVAVEVNGMALDVERQLFFVVDGQLAAIGGVFGSVAADPDPVGVAQFDGIGDEGVDLFIVQGFEFLEASLIHFALQNRFSVHLFSFPRPKKSRSSRGILGHGFNVPYACERGTGPFA